MQNNNRKDGNPKQPQQQITGTRTTETKRFRNVALQSTRFANYQEPASLPVGNPQRTVNTQTTGGNLGVTSSTSTSDLRNAGAAQRFGRGPGPGPKVLVGRSPNSAPGGPVRANEILAQAPPMTIGQPQSVPPPVSVGVGVGPGPTDLASGQAKPATQVQQQYAQPLPLYPIPVPLQPEPQNFVRVQPINVQQPFPQMQPQQIPVSALQPQNQNLMYNIPLQQKLEGIQFSPPLPPPVAAAGENVQQFIPPPQMNFKLKRIVVTNSQGNPLRQELPDEILQNLNEIYENLHLGHLPLTDDGFFQPLEDMFVDVPPKCPEGYEVLLDTENVFVEHADVDMADTFFSVQNQYDVLNTFGDRIYFSGELLNNLSRPDCKGAQNFKLSILSCQGGEVFTLKGQDYLAKLRNRKKELIGSIKTIKGFCDCGESTYYLVKDTRGHTIYKLYHEIGNQNCYDYDVFDHQMVKIGRLSKTWIGLPFPDQELPYSYGINFPVETDVKEKALLMSAMFVAYFQFFEDTQRERRYGRAICWSLCFWAVICVLIMIGLAFLAAYIIMK